MKSFVGDIELIEKLSGQSYADYSAILNKWRNFDGPQLFKSVELVAINFAFGFMDKLSHSTNEGMISKTSKNASQ